MAKARPRRATAKSTAPEILVVNVPEEQRTSDEQHTKYVVLNAALLDEVTDTDGHLVIQIPDLDDAEAASVVSSIKGVKLFSEQAYLS